MFVRAHEHFGDEKNELLDLQFVIYYKSQDKENDTQQNRSEPNRTEPRMCSLNVDKQEKWKEYTKKQIGIKRTTKNLLRS